jgi:biopolymer transport protein ExbD
MAFASFDRKNPAVPMADINMVPLIDVMLVLLVIFIVTAPLLTHAVKLELPRVNSHPNQLKPDKIEFAIDGSGTRYWNGEPLTREEAAARFATEGQRNPQPEIHLRADREARYAAVAETLADASKAGLAKIGFVSEPERP